MAKALAQGIPEYATRFNTNANRFCRELEDLHGEILHLLSPFKGEDLFVFHPSFGYFTDSFGLKQVAIETMGKAPKGKTLSRIIKHIKQKKARVIFIQPQFDPHATASIVEAIQGRVVSIDPLSLDYHNNMMTMARTIARAMTP
ncbi:MAG: zinc ABC transporter substrate-binding protein [Desulfovibrionales bacterium]|nr:zinc ABC transporter substrate-binding protein [Desulfovibrionales bacterium]